MTLDPITVGISLIPVILFYLIYFRYFSLKTVFSKQLQSFFAGMSSAILIMLFAPFFHALMEPLQSIEGFSHAAFAGFFQAAILEKLLALLSLFLLFKQYPRFSVLEGTLSAMMFGIGFSVIENIAYSMLFGRYVIIIRLVYSVPLHITTCGIMGYFLSVRKFCSSQITQKKYFLTAFIFSLLPHGLFDTFLLTRGKLIYLTAAVLVIIVLALEYLLAQAQNTVSRDYLHAARIDFEGWQSISKQPGFERWILRSSGMPKIKQIGFFQWKPGILRFLFVILFFVAAIYGSAHRQEIISDLLKLSISFEEEVTLLGILPSLISSTIIIVGAINPLFFRESKLNIPIITDVEACTTLDIEETFVTYDITPVNCFLKTADRIGIGKKISMTFLSGKKNRITIEAKVVWENHINRNEPNGTLVVFDKKPSGFSLFYFRYLLFRYWKGVFFNLHLPGYEITRRLFMRPISTMQDERLYKSGDLIFKECDRGDEFYLLKKGSVLFYKKKSGSESIITMGTISSGEIFGEMALIGQNSRAASAICVGDCLIASARKDNIEALVENNPEFAMSMIRTLIDRIQMSEKILFGSADDD